MSIPETRSVDPISWRAAVTTVAACHTLGLWRVLHLSARQCPIARARETINLHETTALISTDLWSLNSPDLNPVVEYKVRGIMQQRVYQMKMQAVDNLRHWMIYGLTVMQHSVIDHATGTDISIIACMQQARGGHFELHRKSAYSVSKVI